MSRIQKVVFCNLSNLRLTPGGAGMTGRLGTKYITQDTTPNRMYVWNGDIFVQEGQQAATPVTITGVKGTGSVLTANVNTGWAVTGYQWKRNGTAISGATAATYTQISADANTTLECAVTVGSYVASVYEPLIPPSFTTQPVGGNVNMGSTFALSVAVTGSPIPTLQWFRDGVEIPGATSATYTTPAFTQGDTHGAFWCVATNSSQAVRSAIAHVYSNDVSASLALAAGVPTSGVVGTRFAGSVYASGGRRPFTFAVTAGTLPAGLALDAASGVISGTPTTVTASASLTIRVTDADAATATTSFSLGVVANNLLPVITTQPAAASIGVGGAISFTVAASGASPFTYQWRKGGVAIVGAVGPSYTINSAQTSHAGTYDVVVTNAHGSATSTGAALTVSAVAPSIVRQPSAVSVTAGQPASFSVSVSGTDPMTYQWRKDGVAISGATARIYTIASTVTGDAGAYTVVVTNSAGTVTSSAASLAVAAAPSGGGGSEVPAGALALDGSLIALDGQTLALV